MKVAPCTARSAKYACERWHYSETAPASMLKLGVWDSEKKFVGCMLYGYGSGKATRGDAYGLRKTHDIAELQRVAMRANHGLIVSQVVAAGVRIVKKHCPNLRMLISFADEGWRGHVGTIYQASGWIYTGTFEGLAFYMVHGQRVHPRSTHAKGWKQSLDWIRKNIDPNAYKVLGKKHRYLYPLDKEIKNRIVKLAKPYPKRVGSADSGTPVNQTGRGGASPTSTLF